MELGLDIMFFFLRHKTLFLDMKAQTFIVARVHKLLILSFFIIFFYIKGDASSCMTPEPLLREHKGEQ